MSKNKLSVVLATRNEGKNIGPCLDSVKNIADEIIIVDETSEDNTQVVAKQKGAKIYEVEHEENFHKSKQKAIDYATGDWILQLDADERVSKQLAEEIRKVIGMTEAERNSRDYFGFPYRKQRLFLKYRKLIEQKQGPIGKNTGEIAAYLIPRVNIFLGKPLIHGGVYPDGVIRLIKKGKAMFPAKSVHELMKVDGKVAWLCEDLEHRDSPTFSRYLERANRYTDLTAKEHEIQKIPVNYRNLFNYSFIIPFVNFIKLYIFHKGFLDGMRGFIWSLFSSLHFPLSYFKYWQTKHMS